MASVRRLRYMSKRSIVVTSLHECSIPPGYHEGISLGIDVAHQGTYLPLIVTLQDAA